MDILILTIGTTIFLVSYLWIGVDALRHDPQNGKWAFLSGVYRAQYSRASWRKNGLPYTISVIGMLMILIGILL